MKVPDLKDYYSIFEGLRKTILKKAPTNVLESSRSKFKILGARGVI
jgi:hypothetical protein